MALRLLKARPRSRADVDQRLEAKGFPPEIRAQALEKLTGWGYLDDARFARERAEALARDGYAPLGIQAKLKDHRVEAALSVEDSADRAKALLAKKHLDGPLDDRAKAKAARLLASRGYPEDLIASILGLG